MIRLHREKPKRWELQYSGPGGAFLRPLMRATGIKSLALKRGLFSGADVSFLRKLDHLEGLRVLDWKLRDIRPLESLTSLRKLHLQTPVAGRRVDLQRLPELRELAVDTAEVVTSLKSCANLEVMFVAGLKETSLSNLNSLRKLRVAEFSEPAFDRIGSVDLPELKKLVLKEVRELQDWTGLCGLPALEEFWIFNASGLSSLDAFGGLGNLRWLLLENCGRIDSLEPVAHLPCLRQIDLIGNTRIMDGRITVLLKAPALEHVSFPSRPTYDVTEEQLSAALSELRRPK